MGPLQPPASRPCWVLCLQHEKTWEFTGSVVSMMAVVMGCVLHLRHRAGHWPGLLEIVPMNLAFKLRDYLEVAV